jgi:hypothetical protein
MVITNHSRVVTAAALGAVVAFSGADESRPLIEQLDPTRRSLVLLVLMLVVVVGLALMTMAWLGGRHAKRLARARPPQRTREVSDWDRKQPAGRDTTDDVPDADDDRDLDGDTL